MPGTIKKPLIYQMLVAPEMLEALEILSVTIVNYLQPFHEIGC